MGMEYDLFKPDKKVRFDLGKGFWIHVFCVKRVNFKIQERYKSIESLYLTLLTHIAHEFDRSINLNYFYQLAVSIFNWCGDDVIQFHDQESFNEEHWDIKQRSYDDYIKEFPYTGSRFRT